MMNNDLSNGVPPTVLVHVDVVTNRTSKEVPFLKFWHKTVNEITFDRTAMAYMWNYSLRHEVILELVAIGVTDEAMEELMEHLDTLQGHPFKRANVYPSVAALVEELAYRPDIMGIVDLPERGLRYGSRWIDLSHI